MTKLSRVSFRRESGELETLWGEQISQNVFRLDNSPFYIFGISLADCVRAHPDERSGAYVFDEVVRHSGHSTYRIYSEHEFSESDPAFAAWWNRLSAFGCSYEGHHGFLLSIDVPPTADIFAVYAVLEEGEAAGVWEFEEGHCGHSTDGA